MDYPADTICVDFQKVLDKDIIKRLLKEAK